MSIEGTQPYIHKHVSILPKLPSHPGCCITLSGVPCAVQLVIHVKYSRVYLCIPNSLTIPSPQQKRLTDSENRHGCWEWEGRMQGKQTPFFTLRDIELVFLPTFPLKLFGLFIYLFIFISVILFLRFTLNVVCTYNSLIHSFTLLLVFHYIKQHDLFIHLY